VGCGHFYESGHWLSHAGHHHTHGISCGHYYYDSFWWNYPRLHTHFNGCGHYYNSGLWLDFPSSHIHSSRCGHLYDGLNWYVDGHSGHVHGSSCGHYYYESRWNSYPRTYYTRHRSDSCYFFVDLGDYRRRNIPKHVYEESFDYGGDPTDIFDDRDALSRAYSAFNAGNFYESVIAFNQAINEDPENGIVYIARAQANVAIKDYRSAYEDLIRGMELVPEWSEVELDLAEIYGNPEWFQEHYDSLKRWVSEYPRDYKAHFVLGYFHYFRQDYEAAKSEFVYTLAWDDSHLQAKQLMESILVENGESETVSSENL
jgi:tetratricopeptide (TPR) repeat protein